MPVTDTGRILLCLAVCACAYLAAQRLMMRQAARDRKSAYTAPPLAGDLAAAIFGLQIASLVLVVTGRPGMSALLTLSLAVLLIVLNRAKENVLREPLVLADTCLLPLVWKYPEMYLPFLPMKAILGGTIGVVFCLAALVWAENRIPFAGHGGTFALLMLVVVLPASGLWLLRHSLLPDSIAHFLLNRLPIGHDAAAGAARNGMLAATFMHPVLAGRMERDKPDFLRDPNTRPAASRWPEAFEAMLREVENTSLAECPHVLLLQAESFCDIREHLEGEQKEALKDFLPNWDRLKALGRTLPTPENAYGAYTMRTEFSKLTGLEMRDLGPFACNPYLLAARQPLWSLARFFRNKGYDTVCMHPYHKGFFRRDKVMPNLGFERFLGIETLRDLARFGPYVSDLALGTRILEEMEASPRPVFCFAITMEAHGPWHEGRLTADEIASCLQNPEAFGTGLRLYLCHLQRMDRLLGKFSGRSGAFAQTVWVYGDHEPSGIL